VAEKERREGKLEGREGGKDWIRDEKGREGVWDLTFSGSTSGCRRESSAGSRAVS